VSCSEHHVRKPGSRVHLWAKKRRNARVYDGFRPSETEPARVRLSLHPFFETSPELAQGGSRMTDSLPGVLAPHERFLEFQDRRRRIAAELVVRDRALVTPTAAVADAAAVPAADGTAPDTRRTP
jgi:hypothetical protein